MANQNDIENIVKMLDAKAGAGISRIKIDISDGNGTKGADSLF